MAEVMTVYRPKYKIEGDFIEYNAVVNRFRQITAQNLKYACLHILVKFRELKIQKHIDKHIIQYSAYLRNSITKYDKQ